MLKNALSFVFGGLSVLAFAPFSYYFIILLSLTGLFVFWHQSTIKQAVLQGFLFGLGFMGFGLFWLRISFNEFNHMGLLLSLFLLAGFVFVMALFFALTAYAAKKIIQLWSLNDSVDAFIVMAIVWTTIEIFRGWVFTGFPWLTLGYAFIDSPLVGFASFFGVYFISFVVAISAALLAYLMIVQKKELLILSSIIFLWLGGFLLQKVDFVKISQDSLKVSLIQANISQNIKWQPEQLKPTLDLYLQETALNRDSDLVIWAETAIPAMAYRLEYGFLKPLKAQMTAQNRGVIAGIPLAVEGKILNTMMLFDEQPRQYYAKRHLVPFGEYLPLPFLNDLIAYFNIPMSHFSIGKMPPILKFKTFYLGVSICYEDIFPDDIRDSMAKADILLNISNDAWFGDSLAPYQHLQMARMRAVENGRYFIRATNTGISAVMNEKGKVIASLGLLQRGSLTVDVPKVEGATLYANYGNAPLWFLLFIVLNFIKWRQKHSFLFFSRH